MCIVRCSATMLSVCTVVENNGPSALRDPLSLEFKFHAPVIFCGLVFVLKGNHSLICLV